MHAFISECSFSLTHHPVQSVHSFDFLFHATPFFWIKWHEWHFKVGDLDKSLGDTACARKSCHLMHNTDELLAFGCESSQPWITGLIIFHKDEDISSRFVSNQLERDGLSRISHRQGTHGYSVTLDGKSKGGGKRFRSHTQMNHRVAAKAKVLYCFFYLWDKSKGKEFPKKS